MNKTDDLVKLSFRYNILIMKVLGLYPYDSWPRVYIIYAYIFYIMFTWPPPVLPLIDLIVSRETDIAKICDSGFIISQLGILIVKLLPLKNHPENTKRTIYTLHDDIFNNYTPEQKHFEDDAVQTCRRNFFIFLTFCLGSLFTWPLKVLFYEERRFPIEVWLPFNPFEDDTVYYSVFLWLFVGTGNAAVGNACLDTLITGLIYHAATQIRILKDNLEHLASRVEEQVSEESGTMSEAGREALKARITYKKICGCIDHYDAIYEYANDLETTYSFILFTQFMASIFVICISCLQLTLIEPFTVAFFAMVIYFLTMLIEVFLYCYYGAVLYEESNSVINAIYMSEWYNFDQQSKKALITLMERAKRPMTITAGKLLDLSLETFTMIIRRSYSLLAVLQNYKP
nr:odorant receptor [Semanotus bifasciatus]